MCAPGAARAANSLARRAKAALFARRSGDSALVKPLERVQEGARAFSSKGEAKEGGYKQDLMKDTPAEGAPRSLAPRGLSPSALAFVALGTHAAPLRFRGC